MKIDIEITGLTPFLMCRFSEDALQSNKGISKNLTPRESAQKYLYSDQKGNLFFPGENILSCIISAGRFHKLGKNKLTTTKSTLITAGVMVDDPLCYFDTKEWEVDSRSVVVPATGGRIMCHRPRIDKWSIKFGLSVDETVFDSKFIRKVLDDAGSKCGLGAYRPERKGIFGRFVITNWKEKSK